MYYDAKKAADVTAKNGISEDALWISYAHTVEESRVSLRCFTYPMIYQVYLKKGEMTRELSTKLYTSSRATVDRCG